MDGEAADIEVVGLIWGDRTISKVQAKHFVSPQDADSALDNDPLFYENAPSPTRVATHVIIGRTARGHSVAIYVSETAEPGIWYVHTAHRSRAAHRILRREGKI